MSSGKSPVWRAFDKVERAVGKPLEDAVASRRYVSVMTRGMKVQRALGGAVSGVAGGVVGRVLRVAQIPTRRDVVDLSRQMAVLTREVRDLAAEQQRPGTDGPAAASGAKTTGAAAKPRSTSGGPAAKPRSKTGGTAAKPRSKTGGTAAKPRSARGR